MQNSSILKNELIFQYAAGTASKAKSLMAATYLFLNSKESSLYYQFENYCGEELKNAVHINPKKLTAMDCIQNITSEREKITNPINKFIDSLKDLKWNKIFSGLHEHSLNISNNENVKLIKMDPGTKVPLHSHSGREYILVLEGSFNDNYGKYSKGDLQINDSNIKHTPISCKNEGCVCLTITEKDLIFYGPFGPILNMITMFKSMIYKSK